MANKKQPTRAELLKLAENFVTIKFDYGREYVFPYPEGIALMELFRHAEQLDTTDYENNTITPINSDNAPILKPLSQKEYIDKKMSHILGVSVKGE